MLITNGFYVSDRTSSEEPSMHIEAGTLYIPYDVTNEDGAYAFKEFRVSVPITNIQHEDLIRIANAIIMNM